MEHENLKRISLDDVKNLPDGTNVYVECIGPNWMGPEEEMKSWNIKGKDGMYYSDRSEISFQYDFDYIAEGMEIACYVGNMAVSAVWAMRHCIGKMIKTIFLLTAMEIC